MYNANGEASDWLLGARGIITVSPEMGSDDKEGDTFYPVQSKILPILQTCYYPIKYLVGKMRFTPVISSVALPSKDKLWDLIRKMLNL
jgi:hypothetical protein